MSGQRVEDRIDLSAASSVQLMYSCFVGNVDLEIEGHDFSARFDWVPLLHFANNVDLIVHRLVASETKIYHFTESEDWIKFCERESNIEVSCSYVPKEAGSAPRLDVQRKTRAAGLGFLRTIEFEYPEVCSNAAFSVVSSRMRGVMEG